MYLKNQAICIQQERQCT